MRWLLGLLVTIVYYCKGEVCVHPELEAESADILDTFADGRRWKIVARCKGCGERWTFTARTRHRF